MNGDSWSNKIRSFPTERAAEPEEPTIAYGQERKRARTIQVCLSAPRRTWRRLDQHEHIIRRNARKSAPLDSGAANLAGSVAVLYGERQLDAVQAPQGRLAYATIGAKSN